jgi:c-di-GMP-binding flagellar brake protein YcgR
MEEKRKHLRLNAYVDVVWERIANPAQQAIFKDDKTKNISEGGICLNINEKVQMGEFLDVVILLPNQKTIRSKSRVQWVRESEVVTKRYDVGLEFLNISSQDQEELKAFVVSSFSSNE